jgi:hypothetical protein
VPYTLLGFDLISPHAARVEVVPVHAGSSQGTMQLTGPDVSSRLVKPIPLAMNLCVFEA